MKNFIEKIKGIIEKGVADSITPAGWNVIRTTNVFATIIIFALFLFSLPPMGDDEALFAAFIFGLMQLSIAITIHKRADEIEKKMVEIDMENDRRDNQTATHIELVLHEVQYLVRKQIARDEELNITIGESK